jgi:hypothetical protein
MGGNAHQEKRDPLPRSAAAIRCRDPLPRSAAAIRCRDPLNAA